MFTRLKLCIKRHHSILKPRMQRDLRARVQILVLPLPRCAHLGDVIYSWFLFCNRDDVKATASVNNKLMNVKSLVSGLAHGLFSICVSCHYLLGSSHLAIKWPISRKQWIEELSLLQRGGKKERNTKEKILTKWYHWGRWAEKVVFVRNNTLELCFP